MSESFFQAWQQAFTRTLRMPLFSFLLLFTSSLCGMLCFFSEDLVHALENHPYKTVLYFEVSATFYFPKAADREQKMGTIRFGVYFLTTSLLLQSFFTAGIFLLTSFSEEFLLDQSMPTSYSLWGLIMSEVLIECGEDLEAPIKYEVSRVFGCPVLMKAKYYALAVYILLCVFGPVWTILAGALAGVVRTF